MFGFTNTSEKEQRLKDELEDTKLELRRERSKNEIEVAELRSELNLEMSELRQDHTAELIRKDFEIEKFKDKENIAHKTAKQTLDLEAQIHELKRDLAVAEVKNEMLQKMVDIDSDIINVEELVKSIVNKLPEFRFDGSLQIAPAGKGGDQKK